MKKIFFMLVTLLTFSVASAQTEKTKATTTTTETRVAEPAPQPLKKADGRVTAPDAKVPVVEKRKDGDGKGPIKTKPAPPAATAPKSN